MKIVEYPEIAEYILEADKARKQGLHLACILTCGVLSELVARTIAGDFQNKAFLVLDKLVKAGTINSTQYENFRKIKKIRNDYAHLNFDTNWKKPPYGIGIIEKGAVTFLEEAIRVNSEEEEKDKKNLNHFAHAEIDAQDIFNLMYDTLSSLEVKPEIIVKNIQRKTGKEALDNYFIVEDQNTN